MLLINNKMTNLSESFYDILLPIPFDRAFSYKSLGVEFAVGDVVKVGFGKRNLFGVIVKKWEKSEFLAQNDLEMAKIKEIEQKNENFCLNEQVLSFIDHIAKYNMAPKGSVLKAFIGFVNSDKVKDSLILKSCLLQNVDTSKFKLKELSSRQNEIAQDIIKDCLENINSTALIDGVTGSGKTEVYFKIIAEMLRQPDAQILIMLPEIALTSQIVSRFESVFGFKPALWHSKISKKEKREIFYGIAKNKTKVLIGARSSLLLPFQNLRLIIVDEEHDSSYKQGEIFNFNARDMAILKSKIDNSNVILGSATPSLESYKNAKDGKYKYYSLAEKFNKKTSEIKIIDLRREKLAKKTHISEVMRRKVAENFAKGHQSLLFLNRRGYSPVMFCVKCGEKVECLNCSASLVHHKKAKNLVCHYCGSVCDVSKDCKKCESESSIVDVGIGVEKIKEEVEEFLPQAKIAMVTSDNLTNFNEVDDLVKKISNNEIDIIIGTQMIAKGYDFANLTLVGIVDADSGFYSSDLKAAEKSFQLLSQVFGRAGRKEHDGKILIQTYNPENFIIKKLVANDKEGFYNFELDSREIANLPPFSKMANITVDSLNKNLALKLAKNIVKNTPFNDDVEVLGPAPAKLFRHRNRYYYNVFIKVSRKINLQKLIKDIKNRLDIVNQANIKVDIDP